MLVVVGAPLMFLEMGLDQFCPLPVGNLFKAINVIYDGKFFYYILIQQLNHNFRNWRGNVVCGVLANVMECGASCALVIFGCFIGSM